MPNNFPDNVVDEIERAGVELWGTAVTFVRRPVRASDPNGTVGVFVAAFEYVPDSELIGQGVEPAMGRWTYGIQAMNKNASEEDGRKEAALMSKILRHMLYRDTALRIRLAGLAETSLQTVERYMRHRVTRQRFVNNELRSTFYFVVASDVMVETELMMEGF